MYKNKNMENVCIIYTYIFRTDVFIQATIREKCRHCTVLTIAHRLNTIMDSDRVLVMSGGKVVEFDHPYNLLQIESGHFTKMIEKTGPTMSYQLKNVAWEDYQNKGNICTEHI